MTNNIFARTSQQQATAPAIKAKQNETAETAGSLALKSEKSYLAMNSYDTIIFNTPHTVNVDYSNYASSEFSTASQSGFLSSFANAVAVIGTDCSGGFAGASAGGCTASSGSCGGGGGFTSFV